MAELTTPLELVRALIALLGLIVCGWVVVDSRQDVAVLRTQSDTVLYVVARSNLLRATGLVSCFLILAGLAVRALVIPSQTPSGIPDVGSELAMAAIIVIELLLIGISLLTAWTRWQISMLATQTEGVTRG